MKHTKLLSSIILTTILATGSLFAWTNITTVSDNDPLTSTLWNNLVSKINENGNKLEPIGNNWGNIEITGWTTQIEQEPWTTPSLLSGYSVYNPTLYKVWYMKDSIWFLRLKWLVRNVTTSNFGSAFPIYTLPVSHCPPDLSEFMTPSNGIGYAHIIIVPKNFNSPNHTNCSVYIESITSWIDSWVSLDGIQVPLF